MPLCPSFEFNIVKSGRISNFFGSSVVDHFRCARTLVKINSSSKMEGLRQQLHKTRAEFSENNDVSSEYSGVSNDEFCQTPYKASQPQKPLEGDNFCESNCQRSLSECKSPCSEGLANAVKFLKIDAEVLTKCVFHHSVLISFLFH